MKIAVLISGEYRTFDIAKKSMGFLYDERIDVYFSTWDRTYQENKVLGCVLDEEVSIDRVKNSLGAKKLAGYSYESASIFKFPYRYNSKMIHRWQRGLDLIKYSGVEYDAILIIRPDLYFSFNVIFESVESISKDIFYSAWPMGNCHQDDMVLLGSPLTVYSAIYNINLDNWNIADVGDWHTWFWHDLTNRGINLGQITPHVRYQFVRPNVNDEDVTWDKISVKDQMWRYSLIEQQRRDYGEARVKELWRETIFEEINAFWKNHPNLAMCRIIQ